MRGSSGSFKFSAASGRGLIEASRRRAPGTPPTQAFSAASGRGLIEAGHRKGADPKARPCFPRHRAAASLKHPAGQVAAHARRGFPRHRAAASLKPGAVGPVYHEPPRFPRHRAAASLKLDFREVEPTRAALVFRGIGPRPH